MKISKSGITNHFGTYLRVNERKKMERIVNSRKQADELLAQGWTIKHTNSQGQGYSCGKTCCLGAIFLPLALAGKNKDKTEYILEKPDELKIDEVKVSEVKPDKESEK